ncbi:MAG: hypothetical protein H6Q05_5021 [Acidobacteria bacterium]|nr:hypothetical protein [Acidobacteriota bacterium]
MQRPVALPGFIFHGHLEPGAFDGHHRRVAEESCDRCGIHGCRHDQDLKVRALPLLQPAQECEGDVGREVTFVELIQDHNGHPLQQRIAHDPARENAFGEKPDSGFRTRYRVVPDREADCFAEPLPEFRGDACRCQPRSQSPGLEDEDLAGGGEARIKERARHPGGLARARRGAQHKTDRGT